MQVYTFTWLLGKAEVRRVSCVSSFNFLFGMLKIKAAWSGVAAVEVILYPVSHRRWIPSLGYRKSNSTTYVFYDRFSFVGNQTITDWVHAMPKVEEKLAVISIIDLCSSNTHN